MPAEIRHLLFSEAELTAALRSYSVTSGQNFSNNVSVTFDDREKPVVTVIDLKNNRKLSFAGERLTAALLLCCNKKKIPLPIRGVKEVTILNGRITLIVKLSDGLE